jgi:sugar lactone lactonase YvrE
MQTGESAVFAGTGALTIGAIDQPARAVAMAPASLAFGPDGTLYIGEDRGNGNSDGLPRILKIGKDGLVGEISLASVRPEGHGFIPGIALAPDGTMYVLYREYVKAGAVYRIRPGQAPELFADDLQMVRDGGDLALGLDGTVYVAENGAARVTAITPDGNRRVMAGNGGPAGTDLVRPESLLATTDGTLLITDAGASTVYALGKDGSWKIRAGDPNPPRLTDDLASLPLNSPAGATLDGKGRLVVAEYGRHRIVRFDGATLETVAGGTIADFGVAMGDGGPAAQARFGFPGGIASFGDELVFLDQNSARIRRIDADGIMSSLTMGPYGTTPFDFEPQDASGVGVKGRGLALGPDGSVYWCNSAWKQVCRLKDGKATLVAGMPNSLAKPQPQTTDVMAQLIKPAEGPARGAVLAAPLGLALDKDGNLFVTDSAAQQVYKITDPSGPEPQIAPFAGLPLVESLNRALAGQGDVGSQRDQILLMAPGGICFDKAGNMYVAEIGSANIELMTVLTGEGSLIPNAAELPKVHARVRKIAPDGRVTTIAGPGTRFFGDPTADDALVVPIGLVAMPDGRLVIVDTGANQIKILPAGSF